MMNEINTAATGNNMLRKQLTSQTNELKEYSSKLEFQLKKNDTLNQKISALEKEKKDFLAEKELLHDRIHTMEIKMAKKKTKIQWERKEKDDLIDKLGVYVDKDNISKNLLRNKNDDLERYKISFREKERDMQGKIATLEQEKGDLTEKVVNLNAEIIRLNDLLEIYNTFPNNPPSENEIKKAARLSIVDTAKKESSFAKKKSVMLPEKGISQSTQTMTTPRKLVAVDNREIEDAIKANEIKKAQEKKEKEEQSKLEERKKISEQETSEEKINPKKEENEEGKQKKYPPILLKKKSTIRPSIVINRDSKQEAMRNFVETYFSEKGKDKEKLIGFFEKLSKKIEKASDPESLFLLLQDQKEQKNNQPPKISLIKQQEMLIKKDKEEHPRGNLKPVTIIKQVITQAPKIEDPIYEEYLKWKAENKLENMIEYIKSKSKAIEKFEEEQAKLRRNSVMKLQSQKGFSQFLNSRTFEKTQENHNEKSEPNENLRVKTSDGVFRKRKDEGFLPKKIVQKAKQSLHDIESSNLMNLSEIKDKNEENENFSKKKYFYKYPFRTFEHKFQGDTGTRIDDVTEKFFESLYAKLVKQHEKCGTNCGHLKKFYQRIGFVNKYLQKEELVLSKNLIDKVPYLNEMDDEIYQSYF